MVGKRELRSRLTGVVGVWLLVWSVNAVQPVAAAPIERSASSSWMRLALAALDVPGIAGIAEALVGPSAISRGTDNRLTLLLAGSDHRESSGTGERLDSILVVTINHTTKRISALSIPRDTGFIPLAEGGTFKPKINGLFKYYRAESGGDRGVAMAKFERTIEHVLNIQIDYHALIRFDGFDALVDEVGGVPTPIPAEVRDTGYIDKPGWPKGARFLAASSALLRGASTPRCYGPYPKGAWHTAPNCFRALVYVRSRKGTVGGSANNDWKRSRRQQDFISFAIDRVTSRTVSQAYALRTRAKGLGNDFYTNMPTTDSDVLYLYNLLNGSQMTQQVVLGPTTYATRVPGTSKYKLNLVNVRSLTKSWFGAI